MKYLMTTCALLFAIGTAWGTEPADAEIDYLIDFVSESGCVFHRNGTDHPAAEAAEHLQLKLRRGGKYADTAEHFIDRLASKSSWSGTPYTVTCDGATEPSAAWLHRALDDYRNSTPGDSS